MEKNLKTYKRPLVSIGMTVFNSERFLERALSTLLSQDYENLEIIICDNYSEDSSQDICLKYAKLDPRIKYHRNFKNLGPAENFKLAFNLTSGEYFMWNNSHDYFDSTFISKCIESFEQDNSLLLCFGKTNFVDMEGITYKSIFQSLDTRGMEFVDRFKSVYWASIKNATMFYGVYRSDIIKKTNPLRKTIGHDLIFLAELALLGNILEIEEITYYRQRIRQEETSAQSMQRWLKNIVQPTGYKTEAITPWLNMAFEYLVMLVNTVKPAKEQEALLLTSVNLLKQNFGSLIQQEIKELISICTIEISKQSKFNPYLIELVSYVKKAMYFYDDTTALSNLLQKYNELNQTNESSSSYSTNKELQWDDIKKLPAINLYAGDIPEKEEYKNLIGLSIEKNDFRHILHDVTKPFPLPDNSVESFQAEDVFEHIPYEKLPKVIDEIYRVLKPGANFRLSIPDYGCDVLVERSVKNENGKIIFDPGGGGTIENPGHLWFPNFSNVKALLNNTSFAKSGIINFLHYYNPDGTFVLKEIDYSKGFVMRNPDNDKRVQNPKRPMSVIVDLTKPLSVNSNAGRSSLPELSYTINNLDDSFPKLSFVMIVLNGMPFIKYTLKAIYNFAHEIIIVEGAVEKCLFAANPNGSSKDGTVELIKSFPDPKRKIRLVQGSWPEKMEMQNKALEFASGDYIWLVDSDEVYKQKDIEAIIKMLKDDPSITQINFIPDNFWKGFDYIFVSSIFFEKPAHYRRIFKFIKGAKFASHRPPTMFLPGINKTTEELHTIDGNTTRGMGIYPYHYSYVFEEQVRQKIELYNRYGWDKSWNIDMNLWFNECYLKWTPENKNEIESKYPVWTGGGNSHTKLFEGEHPEVMKDFIESTKKRKIKIAGEDEKEKDLTAVDSHSTFSESIHKVFNKIKPKKIIETGTYLGNGTTKIIASTIKNLSQSNTEFYSIEINPENIKQAAANLYNEGLLSYVKLLNGVSVPRNILPSISEIKKSTVDNVEFENIFVDHQENERAELYYKETDFINVPEDLLGECLKKFDYKPDFVLLDSGGHMGYVEFNYLISQLRGECYIALDDIYHIKHHKSFLHIQNDPRFEIVVSSEEKFGFCVAKFSPVDKDGLQKINPEEIKNIIFLRTDSIGDSVLASSLLEPVKNKFPKASLAVICQQHVSGIYESNPNVNEVVKINFKNYYEDEPYRKSVDIKLESLNADLLINSIFSRTIQCDEIASRCSAKFKLAFAGDTSNISPELLTKTNMVYTSLIECGNELNNEPSRLKFFLKYLGIKRNKFIPQISLLEEDDEYAEKIFKGNNLTKEKTICIAPYAQYDVRDYSGYIKIIEKLPGFKFIIIGAATDSTRAHQEYNSNYSNIINLCGKTTIRQMAAIIKNSKLFIGAESAGAHIACAVGTPNVVIMGGGHFGRFMPYSELTTLVTLPLSCYGCNWKCKFEKAYCVKSIDPELVLEAAKNALEHKSDKPKIYYNELPDKNSREKILRMFSRFVDIDKVEMVEVKRNGILPYSKKIISLAEEAMQLNHLESAREFLGNILFLEPSNLDALNNLAAIEIMCERWTDSLDVLQKVIEIDPNNEVAINNIHFVEQIFNPNTESGKPADISSSLKISVITPSFNQGKFIEQTIQSVLNQNFPNFEHIIIDGGSTDGTIEILKRYPHLKWISEKDKGQSDALNKGFELANGQIIAWINSDDYYEPDAFSAVAEYFVKNPDENIVMGDCNLVDENGKIIDKVINNERGFEELIQYRVSRSIPTQPAVFFRRKLLEENGLLDISLYYAMDYDLWLRFSLRNRLRHIDKTVANYRFHNDAKGGDQNWEKFIPEWEKVSKKYKKQNDNLVSVIIPCFNYGRYLAEAVESVINQTYQNFEIIIVNDGSTDNSAEIANQLINKYASHSIKLIIQKNSGQPAISRNNGIKIATGKYILCLDADDILAPEFLHKCVTVLETDTKISIAYTYRKDFGGVEQIVETEDYDFNVLKNRNIISVASLFRKKAWEDVGGYRTNVKGLEDWDFWIALGAKGYTGKLIREPLFLYRRHDTGLFQEAIKGQKEKIAQIIINNKIVYPVNVIENAELFLKQINNYSECCFVSVVIPTYNRGDKLAEAVQSVLVQTYEDFEIIVVNDAGNDVSGVINSFNDSRIKLINHKENKGLAAARNTGLKNACGKYIAYLDDDDIYYIDHLETLVSFLESNNYDVAYTDSYKATQELCDGSYVTVEKSVPFSNEFSRDNLLKLNLAPVQCFMHKRKCIDETGLFDESLKAHEDWDFWIRFSEKYEFYHIKEITSEFRQRTDKSNMTSSQNQDFYNSYMYIIAKHYNCCKDNPELLAEQINNLQIIKQRAISAGQMSANKGTVEVSIIIPVYNKVELTQQCLLSLYKNTSSTINYEVIVIDNASSDGTTKYLEFAKNIFDNLTVITNRENIGFARANNLGVKHSKGKYVLFLNNDTEPLKGWLEKLCDIIENDPEVAAVGSKLLFPDGSLQHAGVIIIEDKQLPDPLVARHIYWKAPADIAEANKLKTYQALTAACLLVRKNSFEEVGGFDEEYWNGYEDVDICFKLGKLGYKLVYQPASVVIHHESQSGAERFAKVLHNIDRLHKKWIGKVKPDFILEKNGEAVETDAGKIKDYLLPQSKGQNSPGYNINKELYTASIISLSYNQHVYTKSFLDSLFQNTNLSFELILIDNASDKETVDYLKSLSEKDKRIKIIFNKKNLGFPKGVNQGLKIASGKYLVIANNDIVVTKGWLERMIEVAESNNEIGLVGPVSNAVSGVQLDKDARYASIEKMHAYAKKVKKNNSGKTLEFPRVAFLCTLIKKEVIDKIGGLDERFSPGNFEDDDFCLRAQLAGYKTVIAQDIFIHHYGSKSFTAEGMEKYKARLETNQKIFIDKWGGNPEEIWLKGKQTKGRNIMITLNKNEFVENLERALSLIEEKDYAVALRHLNNSIEVYDEYKHDDQELDLVYLLNLAGNISLITGDPEKAQNYFERALNEDNTSSLACTGLGDVLFSAKNYEAAKTMYEWGVKNNSINKAAAEGLLRVNSILNLPANDNSLLITNVKNTTVNALDTAEEPDTDKLINDAYELFNEKEFEKALQKLLQAERLFNGHLSNPTDIGFAASFHNMKGFIYLGLNDTDSARACFEKALSIDPDSSQACAGLGETLFLTEHDNQAKTMFEWAVKNNLNNLFAVGGLIKVNRLLNLPDNHSSLNENANETRDIKIYHRDDFGSLFNKLGLNGKGAEIGVQEGVFSKTLRSNWQGEELYLIDRWKYSSDYKDIANVSDDKQKQYYFSVVDKFADDSSVQIIKKDSVAAAEQFPDEYFDWLYLDADHSFEGSSKDLKAWYPKLKPGGVFAGHDYIDGNFVGGIFGVKSAVDKFIMNTGIELYTTEENTLKSWYFVKPGANAGVYNTETSGNKNQNDADSQKLQSVLNEILEASFDLFGLKYFDEALDTLKKSEELFYSQESKELTSAFENLKGFNYLGLDEKNKARESFSKALNINPESSQACAGLGELFYLEGKDKEAKTMYEFAVKHNPDNQFAIGGLEKVNKILSLPEDHNSMMQ